MTALTIKWCNGAYIDKHILAQVESEAIQALLDEGIWVDKFKISEHEDDIFEGYCNANIRFTNEGDAIAFALKYGDGKSFMRKCR